MKALCHLWAGILILASLGSSLHAQDERKESAVRPKIVGAEEVKKGPVSGKLVILQTGHVMEGDVKRTDTQICIRNDKSELWISCDKALRICADWHDAYRYLQTLIDSNDAGGHVRLARWCFANQLHDQALEQVKQALQLQPTNTEAKQMRGSLERARLDRPAEKAASPGTPAAKTEIAAEVNVTYDTLVAFANKVQPILMNTCANCHSTDRAGKFQLRRVSSLSQKAATEQNLARVLAFLDMERPSISPLLVKAVQIHWKDQAKQPPIKDRSAAAFQAMQFWTEQLIARNPHLREQYVAKKSQHEPKLSSSTTPASFASPEENVVRPAPHLEVRPTPSPTATASATITAKTSPLPREPATQVTQTPASAPVEDCADPGPFNQQYHPGR